MHGGHLVQKTQVLDTRISAAPEDLDLCETPRLTLAWTCLQVSVCPLLLVEPACEQDHPPLSGRCGNGVQRLEGTSSVTRNRQPER